MPAAPALLLAMLLTAAPPEEEPLISDRPDFTESTQTVPSGRAQIEGGWTLIHDSGDTENTLGELLIRLGLGPALEGRIALPSFVIADDARGNDGWTDATLGLKLGLLPQAGRRPAFSLIVQADLPTGSDEFGGGTVVPTVKLLWSAELSENWSLAG